MNARIGFKLQVTATPGFHSLYDWCYQTMWLFSGAPEAWEYDTVTEKHGAEALYSTVKSLMHAIRTEDEEAEQDVAHPMIQIAKHWTWRQWSESKVANGKPRVQIPKENAHLIDFGWTEDASAKNISVRAEWLDQSGRAPSEPSETPRWRITPHPATRTRVASGYALRSPFHRFF